MDLETLKFLEGTDFSWSEHRRKKALVTIRILAEMLLEEKIYTSLEGALEEARRRTTVEKYHG